MKCHWARVAVFLACLCVLFVDTEAAKGATKRLERMRALAGASNLIELDDSLYSSLVLTTPRNYTFIVMYTARDPQYRCGHCGSTEIEVQAVASSVARLSSIDQRTVFVGVADYPTNQQAFQTHRLQRVPVVVVHPPQSNRNRHFVELPDSHKLSGFTAAEMLEGLENFDIKVPLWRDPSDQWVRAYAVGVVVAMLAYIIVGDPKRIAFFRYKSFWMFISWIVFAFCVGGLVLCVIRLPPWYSGQYGGGLSVFDTRGGRGNQNILEGAVIGLLLTLFAGGVIMLHNAAREGKSSHHNIVIGGIGAAMATVALLRIATQYQASTKWYQLQGPLPPEMSQWVRSTWRSFYKAYIKNLFK